MMEDRTLSLGQLMFRLRKNHKKTQEWVARKMGIHSDKLRQYEKDIKQSRPDELIKFITSMRLTDPERKWLLRSYTSTINGEIEKHEASLDLKTFPLGDQEIADFVIIDGVGDSPVPFENIEIEIDESPAEIPPKLRFFYDKYVQDIEHRKRQGDSQIPFDGDILGVKTITVTRTPNSEMNRWSITLKKNKFYSYVSLVQNLDTEFTEEGRRKTIRKEYISIEDYHPCRPPPFLDYFGVMLTVYLKKDDRVVIVRRAATEVHPNCLGIVAEGLRPSEDLIHSQDPFVSVVNCALRGIREELGLDITPECLTFLSLGFDRHYYHYNLVGLISVNLSFKELVSSVRMAPDARLEIANIFSIPGRPAFDAFKELFDLTRRVNLCWPPCQLATLMLGLRFLNPSEYKSCNKMLSQSPRKFGPPIPYNLLIPSLPPLTGTK